MERYYLFSPFAYQNGLFLCGPHHRYYITRIYSTFRAWDKLKDNYYRFLTLFEGTLTANSKMIYF